jgi:hypothetical protein
LIKVQNDEKINDLGNHTKIQELEKSIFEKESRLEEISIMLIVLESRLDFLNEVSS